MQSNWLGEAFGYDGAGIDYVVRFCKDVESRSQPGYVGFGRFDGFNYFAAGSGEYDFVQLNMICGDCPNARCKGGLECVCNVTFESDCSKHWGCWFPCVALCYWSYWVTIFLVNSWV